MTVRLIEEGLMPGYPWALVGEDGFVKLRFKNAADAEDWAARHRYQVVTDIFPNYGE